MSKYSMIRDLVFALFALVIVWGVIVAVGDAMEDFSAKPRLVANRQSLLDKDARAANSGPDETSPFRTSRRYSPADIESAEQPSKVASSTESIETSPLRPVASAPPGYVSHGGSQFAVKNGDGAGLSKSDPPGAAREASSGAVAQPGPPPAVAEAIERDPKGAIALTSPQIDVNSQKTTVTYAEEQVESRLQSGRKEAAQQATSEFELNRAAERAALGAADEVAGEAEVSAMAQADDRLHVARQRAARQFTADYELERRVEAARIVAEREAGQAAANRARFAQLEVDERAAALDVERRVAAEASATADTEDRQHTARQQAARGRTAEFRENSDGRAAGPIGAAADVTSRPVRATLEKTESQPAYTGSISLAPLDRQTQQSGRQGGPRGLDGLSRSAAAGAVNSSSLIQSRHGDSASRQRHRTSTPHGLAKTSASVMVSLNGQAEAKWSAVYQRRCPSILEDANAFDDDLVWLCRSWAERR
jgi:hypothetical protein